MTGVWDIGQSYPVWMSHGDRVTELPAGFKVVATSPNAPFAIAVNEEKSLYTTMFHPEVVHTPDGGKLLQNFVHNIVGLESDWTMAAYRQRAIEKIRAQVGKGRVICGLSGGVNSSVAAVLIHEAIGDQLTCILVDHGLMRLNEADEVVTMFRDHYNIPLVHVDATREFLSARSRVRPTPRPSARRSAGCSSRPLRPRRRSSAARNSSRRARSIPTSSSP